MTTRTSEFTGGCLCGALRYTAHVDPSVAGLCYCADCRKASGSGFMPFMQFPAAAVRFSGPSQSFSCKAANGRDAVRNFCPECGGLVFGGDRDAAADDSVNIYAGSLDDPSLFRPTVAVFTRTRPDWAIIPADVTVLAIGA